MRYLVVILLLSSCTTERKAIKWMNRHDAVSSAYCLQRYPVKEHRDTVVEEADYSACDSAYYDLWRYMETLRDSIEIVDIIHDSIIYRTRSKIITKTITITQIDSAACVQKSVQIKALEKQLELTQKVANTKITKILGIAFATLAAMAYQIRRLLRKTKK